MKLKFAVGTDFGAFIRAHTDDEPNKADRQRAALAINLIDSLDGDVTLSEVKHVLAGTGTFIVEEDGRSLRFERTS